MPIQAHQTNRIARRIYHLLKQDDLNDNLVCLDKLTQTYNKLVKTHIDVGKTYQNVSSKMRHTFIMFNDVNIVRPENKFMRTNFEEYFETFLDFKNKTDATEKMLDEVFQLLNNTQMNFQTFTICDEKMKEIMRIYESFKPKLNTIYRQLDVLMDLIIK